MADDGQIIGRIFSGDGRLAIIGVGNAERGDDGAGIAAARQLAAALRAGSEHPSDLVISEQSGEGASLIESWRGFERVVLIDAVRAGGLPGTIHRIDIHAKRLPSGFFHYSTHAFSIAEAVELARVLGDLPPAMLVYGIEGADFRPGSRLTTAVERAVAAVVGEIGRQLL